ncbi:hypothetical protein CPLU01_08430 [Colletotrichum plurivorum]|uniref:Uncharacterized protein n=1 Tax=Colletotrichum plurivorum TaxID=2175906 RepID=A0A8H6KCM5_9PEZI|nr:hypothetical protein CPLU01_08430 [Colletotrichum plurivorum]
MLSIVQAWDELSSGSGGSTTTPQAMSSSHPQASPRRSARIARRYNSFSRANTPGSGSSPEKGRGADDSGLTSDISGGLFNPIRDESDDKGGNGSWEVSSFLFGDGPEVKWMDQSGEVVEGDDGEWEDMSADDDAQGDNEKGDDAQDDEDDIYDP